MGYELTALVTLLAILVTIFFMGRTGAYRGKFKVDAPAMVGHKQFDRAFRVHANTVEQIVLFLPALWLSAITSSDALAAGIGSVWIVGRVLYSFQYMKDPAGRTSGVLITLLSTAFLTIVALFNIARALLGQA